MPRGRAYVFAMLAALVGWALPGGAQSVISTHSGLINYFEGAVYLGDQALEAHLGRYPSVPEGGVLHTAEGRAEVLLTPGVFLRMGEKSSIRMVADDLADTQVELQAGSMIVDAGPPNLHTSVTLIYQQWKVHLAEKGVYRMDADPPRLSVREGRAEVLSAAGSQPVSVEHGMTLPFAGVLVAEPSQGEWNDALGEWSKGRGQSISADDAITAQLDEDAAAQASGAGDFTYFPLLGLPAVGPRAGGVYGSYYPAQAGFNSIYLPGYTYRPLILGTVGGFWGTGLGGTRLPGYVPSIPRFGVLPGAAGMVPGMRPPIGVGGPRPPLLGPGPRGPAGAPGLGHPGGVHAPAFAGAHGGAHR